MLDAGITDPDSAEGILFCAGDRTHESQCPYDYCVLEEFHLSTRTMRKNGLVAFATRMYRAGISHKDIAIILGLSYATTERYLNECLAEENKKTMQMSPRTL
jgi:hypothetical protein